MKRFAFGIAAILSMAILPFSGLVSAASSVDYEKSVGQVDGADTINWVVEATDDGGYVVGGQTIVCYKGITGSTDQLSDYAPERVSIDECIEYHKQQYSSFDEESFADAVNNSYIANMCGFHHGLIITSIGTMPKDGTLAEDEVYYYGQCVDYIAKFKSSGSKEWLTTVDNGSKPIAVRKVGNNYRMLLNDGSLYTFSGNGVEQPDVKLIQNCGEIAYLNEDGSLIALNYESKKISYYDANGTFVRDFGDNLLEASIYPTESGYVIGKMTYDSVDGEDIFDIKIYDVSKDLGSWSERELEYQVGVGILRLITANKGGAVIIAVDNNIDNKYDKLIAFNKNGKKIDELDGYSEADGRWLIGYKDFAIGITTNRIEQTDQIEPIVKIIKFDDDLTIKYEYKGSGNEYIADVAELIDESLAGVGIATKGSSKMPVTGDANGGYLRLVAKQDSTPASSERPVDNPKTWDAVDTVATIGGIALLGLGVFLRKNLSRR